MAFTIRPVEYFYANSHDELGAAHRLLEQLALGLARGNTAQVMKTDIPVESISREAVRQPAKRLVLLQHLRDTGAHIPRHLHGPRQQFIRGHHMVDQAPLIGLLR